MSKEWNIISAPQLSARVGGSLRNCGGDQLCELSWKRRLLDPGDASLKSKRCGGHKPHGTRLQFAGCGCIRASVAHFEVKLIDAAAVRLRNGDEIIVDLNLFTLF